MRAVPGATPVDPAQLQQMQQQSQPPKSDTEADAAGGDAAAEKPNDPQAPAAE
jgi:hypothetical protein